MTTQGNKTAFAAEGMAVPVQQPVKAFDMATPIASAVALSWHWKDSTIPLMQSVYGKLSKMAAAESRFLDQYHAANTNPNLTDAGKLAANEAVFSATLAPIYRDVQMDGQSIKNMIASLKANSLPRVDPADVAGAMTRSDIRRIFLQMEPVKRTVAIKANPSKQLAAALLEFPPELLGLSQQDVADLTAAFGESAYPEYAAQIAELGLGLDAAKTVLQMVVVLAADKLRMNRQQVETLIWGGTLPDSKRL
jgi:hypothetical protein